ncbi:MAG: HipA domain-containing protein [Treponema sp.]|nr:HipA domain-containing protein [Candidatus Treponema equifaecale]
MSNFSLTVLIEINGTMTKAGTITGTDYKDAVFTYDEAYIADKTHRPISISLPLTEKLFSPESTRNYFEGLLPEGFTRKSIADFMHSDPDDYISILRELGRECLGAIQIVDESDQNIEADYRELTKKEVKALAEEGASLAANLVIQSHLSLTGASGKTGLYYDEKKKKWYQPVGSAPSNYIVKQTHVRLSNIVVNEQLCLLTAKKLGIDIPESFIIQTGKNKTEDADILFATKRFDRFINDDSKKLNGLPVPYRLHQEDFAQALGINSSQKYEKNNEHYLKQMFNIIRAYSANPIEDQLKLWRIAVFNFLIGNTDNHIKNYSLLYKKDLRTVRLAPCYDVVATCVYKNDINEMSLSINGKLNMDEVTRSDFELEAKSIGLGTKPAMKIFDEIQDGLLEALKKSAGELEEKGFAQASEIAEKIEKGFKCRKL